MLEQRSPRDTSGSDKVGQRDRLGKMRMNVVLRASNIPGRDDTINGTKAAGIIIGLREQQPGEYELLEARGDQMIRPQPGVIQLGGCPVKDSGETAAVTGLQRKFRFEAQRCSGRLADKRRKLALERHTAQREAETGVARTGAQRLALRWR